MNSEFKEKIEDAKRWIEFLSSTVEHLDATVQKYREALREIQQLCILGIHESDSVSAATEMERIAREALE